MQSEPQSRKDRMDKIRAAFKSNTNIKKNSLKIESTIEKRRKSMFMSPEEPLISPAVQTEQVKSYSKFHEKYTLGEIIGEGSNGLVKKCFLKDNNELFAVKKITMDDQHILFLKKNFKDIRQLDHPNIIKYQQMYLDMKKNICFLVMEYCSEFNLQKLKLEDELEIKQVMYQLFCTLEYIHSMGICHRDIKPENILLDRKSKQIKIIDFGISKKIKERGVKRQMLTNTGTLYYRAPEIFNGGGYDEKVDIWAAGCTLYYFIVGSTPFQSEYHSSTIENIMKGELHFTEKIWDKYNKFAKDLVIRLLKPRNQRLSAAQACKHFWFDQNSQSTHLTKSDLQSWNYGSDNQDEGDGQQMLNFHRSLTNNIQPLKYNNKQGSHEKKEQVQKLRKWIMHSDDDNILIEMNSEVQDSPESSPLRKHN